MARIRDRLLRIPVPVVCAAAVAAIALFFLVDEPAAESAILVVPPLGGIWLVSGVLILVRAHRAALHFSNSLFRFSAPIVVGLAFLFCTAYAGKAIAGLLSASSPH
jgi:hypothetical protein